MEILGRQISPPFSATFPPINAFGVGCQPKKKKNVERQPKRKKTSWESRGKKRAPVNGSSSP